MAIGGGGDRGYLSCGVAAVVNQLGSLMYRSCYTFVCERQKSRPDTFPLDDLDLIYQMDVSIFDWIENKSLVEHINRVGVIFYEANE